MVDCIFCKIVSREIDAKRVYEDESTLAFLDISPANKGHALIIPKYHAETIYDIPEEVLRNVIASVKRVAVAVKKSINPQGINILQSNEKAAHQEVGHVHFHVVPRYFEDGTELKFSRMQVSEEEQKKIAKTVREAVESPEAKKEDKVDATLNRIDVDLKKLDDVLK